MEAWSGHTALVPTTEHGEKFGAWEDVDPARPTLVQDRSRGTSDGGSAERGVKRSSRVMCEGVAT